MTDEKPGEARERSPFDGLVEYLNATAPRALDDVAAEFGRLRDQLRRDDTEEPR